jgi:pyruvate dehydrogenase E1 component alpha subunit
MDTQATTLTRDWVERYEPAFLLGLFERMYLIREFETRVKYLFLEGSMPGTIHQCEGQEATAVGVCAALRHEDVITSTHRPHGHALAKGLTPEEMLIELFGGGTGCCRGKGGSMHVGNIDKGMIPAIAIVGGGIPVATGVGLAFKLQHRDNVCACFFGDGATSEGAFHEAVNMAAIWDLPVVFACENNFYGASTHVTKITRVASLADRAAAYGIPTEVVDGNNVLAVYEAAERAVTRCRQGAGPVFLELQTYRRCGHSRRDGCHYQPANEREAWFERDPLEVLSRGLLLRSDVDEAAVDTVRQRVDERLSAAIEVGRNAPKPTVADLVTDVYA